MGISIISTNLDGNRIYHEAMRLVIYVQGVSEGERKVELDWENSETIGNNYTLRSFRSRENNATYLNGSFKHI